MERLALLKTLGDNTRYAIYLEIARAASPLSTADIAETLGLHQNTVRPHLERMREVGLLEVEIDARGAVGRPQHRYCLAADAPSLGLEPPAFPALASMLAGVAASAGPAREEIVEAGRIQGRRDGLAERRRESTPANGAEHDAQGADADAETRSDTGARSDGALGSTRARRRDGPTDAHDAAQDAERDAEHNRHEHDRHELGRDELGRHELDTNVSETEGFRTSAGHCAAALLRQMATLGFDPAAGGDPAGAMTVAFTHCPYRELAEVYPELVCHLHRGMIEGFVEGYVEGHRPAEEREYPSQIARLAVDDFHTLVDRDPCQVSLRSTPVPALVSTTARKVPHENRYAGHSTRKKTRT